MKNNKNSNEAREKQKEILKEAPGEGPLKFDCTG